MSNYTIVPIIGREAIQKNFITLPQKADNYSGRHPSLNERFSVIERGYMLASNNEPDFGTDMVQLRKLTAPFPREQLKKAILAESEKRRMKQATSNMKTGLADSCDSQPTTP